MSFVAAKRERSGPVVPLASMVDILFLLLLFFLTTSIYREQEAAIDVSLPGAQQGQAQRSPNQIVISIQSDGTVFLGQREHSLDSLRSTLIDLARISPDESVVIRGDQNSRLGLIVKIMDIANAAKLRNVFIATTKPASEVQ